jgi:hypothetical protein
MSSKTTSRTKKPAKKCRVYKLKPWFGEWAIYGPRNTIYGFYSRKRDAVRGFTRMVNRNGLDHVKLQVQNAYSTTKATIVFV